MCQCAIYYYIIHILFILLAQFAMIADLVVTVLVVSTILTVLFQATTCVWGAGLSFFFNMDPDPKSFLKNVDVSIWFPMFLYFWLLASGSVLFSIWALINYAEKCRSNGSVSYTKVQFLYYKLNKRLFDHVLSAWLSIPGISCSLTPRALGSWDWRCSIETR